MKTIALFLLMSCLVLPVFGEDRGKSGLSYRVTGTSKDASLQKNEAKFIFTFLFNDSVWSQRVRIYEGKTEVKAEPDKHGIFSLETTPGKHKFCFISADGCLSADSAIYLKVVTDSIAIAAQHKTEITIYFTSPTVTVDKPVIYLYPEKKTDVRVQLALQGQLTFAYPAYENGWSVSAEPNGMLHTNGKTYNYLFWEGQLSFAPQDKFSGEGFVVEKENLLAFLETSLEKIGLQSKEAQDFITYWYPRMQGSEKNYVRFLFNTDCEKYAALDITPKPDRVLRVYMLWSPLKGGESIGVQAQEFPAFERKGFTVVEWGGTELAPGSVRPEQ